MKVIAFVCFVIAFGCQPSIQGTRLRLEMTASQQAVLFVVHDDEVSYGGGLNAVKNKTTWHGSMTLEQREEFSSLLTKWKLKRTNNSLGEGVGKYNIRLREGSSDETFELPLTDTNATKVYDLLMKVADSRFNETLDALAKPSVDAMLQNRGLGEKDD
jgi:hypothetical protein|tara:strand:- start:66 stop:539 length:474 start_codon:yes stop_codon:yes gene_type:complete